MPITLGQFCRPLYADRVSTLKTLTGQAAALDLDVVLVGAFARDIWLCHLLDIDPPRKTMDMDFGVAIADWSQLEHLRDGLIACGFAPDAAPEHPERLTASNGVMIDLLPFGGVTDPAGGNITWPHDGVTMSVLGFAEACRTAMPVEVQADLVIPVARPEAIVLLKLMAWRDRTTNTVARRKHVADIMALARTFPRLAKVTNKNNDQVTIPDDWGMDALLGGLWLIARAAGAIATADTSASIVALLNNEASKGGRRDIVRDINRDHTAGQWSRAEQAVQGLAEGFATGNQNA